MANKRAPRFIVYADRSGQYRWRLVAANGRIVADSGEAYTRRHDAVRAAGAAVFCAGAASVEVRG